VFPGLRVSKKHKLQRRGTIKRTKRKLRVLSGKKRGIENALGEGFSKWKKEKDIYREKVKLPPSKQ